MSKNKNPKRQVERRISADRIYGSLDAAIKFLQEVKEKHPSATVSEHWTGYEDMELVVSWREEETDEEYRNRLDLEERQRRSAQKEEDQRREREKRQEKYEELKREFGG